MTYNRGTEDPMTERMRSITDARQNLPNLSQSAQEHMERFVITNQGQPQSVLVGYLDYQQMKAATELSLRPDAVADILQGLAETRRGERMTPDDVMKKLWGRDKAATNCASNAGHEKRAGARLAPKQRRLASSRRTGT